MNKNELSPTQRIDSAPFAERLADLLREAPQPAIEGMRAAHGRVVLNTESLFMLAPWYVRSIAARRALAPALYPVAAAFIEQAFQRLLALQMGERDTVVFTAGGCAAGKSDLLRTRPPRAGLDFAVDTPFSDVPWALEKVEAVLASRRNVAVDYVFRPFEASLRAMLSDALHPEIGRARTVGELARSHAGAQAVILELLARYKKEPRVKVDLWSSTEGHSFELLSEEELVARPQPSVEELSTQGNALLDEWFHSAQPQWHGRSLPLSLYKAVRSAGGNGKEG